MSSEPDRENFLEFCKALANTNRQKILFEIFTDKSEHMVSEIADRMKLATSTASEHLTILRKAGILLSDKREREVYYRINKDAVHKYMEVINQWLSCC